MGKIIELGDAPPYSFVMPIEGEYAWEEMFMAANHGGHRVQLRWKEKSAINSMYYNIFLPRETKALLGTFHIEKANKCDPNRVVNPVLIECSGTDDYYD